MGYILPSSRRGSFRTRLHASASGTLAVPADLFGGVYNTSPETLFANSAMANVTDWAVYGIVLLAVTTAARTLTFYSVKADGTTYDEKGFVIPIKSGAVPGEIIPVGGPDGQGFGADRGDLPGGFAVIASNNEVVGTIFWTPIGSY